MHWGLRMVALLIKLEKGSRHVSRRVLGVRGIQTAAKPPVLLFPPYLCCYIFSGVEHPVVETKAMTIQSDLFAAAFAYTSLQSELPPPLIQGALIISKNTICPCDIEAIYATFIA